MLAGERLKRALGIAGIDRKELSRRTKVLYSTLGNYEHGTRKLPIRIARKIEAATKVPSAYLMGLIDEMDMEILMMPREAREGFLKTIKAMQKEGVTSASHPFQKAPTKPASAQQDSDYLPAR